MKVELEKFKNVFEGFNGGFGVFHFKDSPGPKQKGKNYTSRDSLTDEIWLNHLTGKPFKARIIKQDGEEFQCDVDSIGIVPVRKTINVNGDVLILMNIQLVTLKN